MPPTQCQWDSKPQTDSSCWKCFILRGGKRLATKIKGWRLVQLKDTYSFHQCIRFSYFLKIVEQIREWISTERKILKLLGNFAYAQSPVQNQNVQDSESVSMKGHVPWTHTELEHRLTSHSDGRPRRGFLKRTGCGPTVLTTFFFTCFVSFNTNT